MANPVKLHLDGYEAVDVLKFDLFVQREFAPLSLEKQCYFDVTLDLFSDLGIVEWAGSEQVINGGTFFHSNGRHKIAFKNGYCNGLHIRSAHGGGTIVSFKIIPEVVIYDGQTMYKNQAMEKSRLYQ